VILGPKSDDASLLMSNAVIDRKALPEGRYSGKFLFDVENNMYENITSRRALYEDIRIKETIERKVGKYIKENSPSAEALEARRKEITKSVMDDEKEFKEDFKKAMDELDSKLYNSYYHLTITSQTTAVLTKEGSDISFNCSIKPTGETGEYLLTINVPQKPVTAKLVITPTEK
jgi:hypothetical protein